MSDGKNRRPSIFGAIVLVVIGGVFLLHNFYGNFDGWDFLYRWWPVFLILAGVAKLVDYAYEQRTDGSGGRGTGAGQVLAVIFLVIVIVGAIVVHHVRGTGIRIEPWPHMMNWGETYSFSEASQSQAAPATARVNISTPRGDITVHAEDTQQIRVEVKKSANAMSEHDAEKRADEVHVVITDNHDGSFDVRPVGTGHEASRVDVNMEVYVPQKAAISASTGRGDVQAFAVGGNVDVNTHNGDIEVQDSGSDVTAATQKGDVRITTAGGNVKLSGRGDEVEISDVKGEAAIEGEFYGPIRLARIAKGAHILSQRTNLTVTSLAGHLDAGSGNIEIADVTGDVTLDTQKNDVTLENVAGRILIEDHDGDVEMRFAQPPHAGIDVSDGSGDISVTLPSQAAFQMDAQSESGDADSDFASVKKTGTEDSDRAGLSGQQGERGPLIHLRTSYGDIHLKKKAA
ncbi:MAG: DUF4097 family beta strand repeat-containing protein [Candidatus Acidiferrales bacterium]